MKQYTIFMLFLLFITVFQQNIVKAQSGFVNITGNTATNSSFSVGQTFANNASSTTGYSSEGLQYSFLYQGEDTLLAFTNALPHFYRDGSRNPIPPQANYAYTNAGLYSDQYLLPTQGIDSLIDVMFYTVAKPANVDTVAPYSVCAIPIPLPQPIVKPDHSVPPVVVTNDERAEYACDSTTEVTWNFSVYNKNLTHIQDVTVHFPPCGAGDGFEAVDFENNHYQSIRLGCYCWTKENLKSSQYSDGVEIPFARVHSSDLYPDETANLNRYGRLYSWYSAVRVPEGDNSALPSPDANGYVQGVCPMGWRIPSQFEMELLASYDIEALKTTTGWIVSGTDATGFSALPGGMYSVSANRYCDIPGSAYFWTTACGPIEASDGHISYYCNSVLNELQLKGDGMSIRCIKN